MCVACLLSAPALLQVWCWWLVLLMLFLSTRPSYKHAVTTPQHHRGRARNGEMSRGCESCGSLLSSYLCPLSYNIFFSASAAVEGADACPNDVLGYSWHVSLSG